MFKIASTLFSAFAVTAILTASPAFAHKGSGSIGNDALDDVNADANSNINGNGNVATSFNPAPRRLRASPPELTDAGVDVDVDVDEGVVQGSIVDGAVGSSHINSMGTSGNDGGDVDYDDDDDDDFDILRIIVQCPDGISHHQCVQDLQRIVSKATGSPLSEGANGHDGEGDIGMDVGIGIIHDLDLVDAVAMSMRLSDMRLLDGYEYHLDPVREPLYIRDSVVVEDLVEHEHEYENGHGHGHEHGHGRNMQTTPPQRTPYGINMVNAPSVWDAGVTGDGAKVCVLDTGLRADHADLDGSKMSGYSGRSAVTPWDRDGNGHGTHVTGTIAASDNDRGVVGVAPQASVYTVRVFNDRGVFSSDLMSAAQACRSAGAHVISMSLGGGGSDARERRFFEQLYSEGILSVAASGNSGAQGNQVNYPAAYDVVVSVGAVDSSRGLASFSTRNDRVDLSAPGVNVRSTWNNGGYSTISGTSMACPHVSGVAALLKSYNKDLTAAQIFQAMTATAEDRGAAGKDPSYGHGIVDAFKAYSYIKDTVGGGDDDGDDGTDAPVPAPTRSPVPAPTRSPVPAPTRSPVPAPTPAPAASPTRAPTVASPTPTPCKDLRVQINMGRDADEISHSLTDVSTGEVVWSRAEYSSGDRDDISTCVDPTKCWRYDIADSGGDGLSGFWSVLVLSYDGNVEYRGRRFGEGGSLEFGEGCV